jgi:hypothetical protein
MIFEIDDINYEDMDDLALSDHIEWNHAKAEDFSSEALNIFSD